MIKYMKLNDNKGEKMNPNEILNELTKPGSTGIEYGRFTIKMTKNDYVVTDNTAPDVYNPVFSKRQSAISFWELLEFLLENK